MLILATLLLAAFSPHVLSSPTNVTGYQLDITDALIESQQSVASNQAEWRNAFAFTSSSSLGINLLAYYPFDAILTSSFNNATSATIINRTASPNMAPGSPYTFPASITGNGTGSISPLTSQGLFGGALNLASYSNFAQLLPSGPFPSYSPTTGFTVSLWFNPSSSTTGTLIEVMFDSIAMNTERGAYQAHLGKNSAGAYLVRITSLLSEATS
jgi:hypothetical protein